MAPRNNQIKRKIYEIQRNKKLTLKTKSLLKSKIRHENQLNKNNRGITAQRQNLHSLRSHNHSLSVSRTQLLTPLTLKHRLVLAVR